MQSIWNSWSKLVIKRYWKDSWTAIGQRFTTFPQISPDDILFLVTPNLWAWRIRHGIAEKIRRKLIVNSWVLICTLANLGDDLVVQQLSYSQNLSWCRSIFSFQLGREKLTLVGRSQKRGAVADKIRMSSEAERWVESSWLIADHALSTVNLLHAAKTEIVSGIHDVEYVRVVGSWVRGWWEKLEWDFGLVLPSLLL